MRVLLDATFVIDYLRAEPAAVQRWRELISSGDEPLLNEIVVCEVRTGVAPIAMDGFLRFIRPIEFIQPGPDAALVAGEWRAQARIRGRTLGLADALIAAGAQAVGATVLTRNVRDFSLTPVAVADY